MKELLLDMVFVVVVVVVVVNCLKSNYSKQT